MATTLPIFGAILPSAAAGLRPICDQVCASECTSACERMERTIAIFGSCCASFGSRPVGNRIAVDGVRREARGRDAVHHLEVERVGVAGRAGQQDEDHVLRLVMVVTLAALTSAARA